MRLAAIQLEAAVGDVASNLAACERLGAEAGAAGAELIVLPEFFSTGIGFVPELAEAALPADGPASELLCGLAREHGAYVGGSFLCRDGDGEVRNAFLLATPAGAIAGRHDKDLPTMWENCFYVGGEDDGVLDPPGGPTLGAALCWELMRTRTVHRLAGRVDLVVAGSGWWSLPENWPPRSLFARGERRNRDRARRAVTEFPLYVGAPIVHAGHAGRLACRMPESGLPYRGRFEGATLIADADGRVIAERLPEQGEGCVVADLEPGRRPPRRQPPRRFWLRRRGAMAAVVWNTQRLHGRRFYRRRARSRYS
jgi:predicted amidohydrolase